MGLVAGTARHLDRGDALVHHLGVLLFNARGDHRGVGFVSVAHHLPAFLGSFVRLK